MLHRLIYYTYFISLSYFAALYLKASTACPLSVKVI